MHTVEASPITLNADQLELAQRHIKGIYFALSTIDKGLTVEAPLSKDLAENCLKVAEFNLRYLCEVLDIETDGTAERDERYALLRTANERVRALEAQLGDSQAGDRTQLGVKALSERLNTWWDVEGFGHIAELHFGPHGVEAKFSCMLFGDFHLTSSKTPVSDRERKAQWFASLAERGFVLCVEKGEREPSITDCDQNRQALEALFAKFMPSAEVIGFNSRGRRGALTLHDFDVFIRDYDDIQSLPVPQPEA